MNYTKNYRLPQWVKEDRIMMDDFNAAMASMESGMTASTSIANTAKQTADAAKQRVDTAYTPDNKPYAVGAYTGDGETYRDIKLGFRPSFVILCTDQRASQIDYGGIAVMMAGPSQSSLRIYMTDTGFHLDSSETVNPYPEVNKRGKVYNYIAFR